MGDSRAPKWAQPICAEHKCSICEHPIVYYSKIDTWTGEAVLNTGHVVEFLNMAMKCWCKDCFEDCGGQVSDFKNFH